jgi:methylmalonyl-CoA/ethylmalonyl-CoA epimerase
MVTGVGGILGLGPVRQIACVVDDLDQAVRRRLSFPGRSTSWSGWTYGPQFLTWQQVDGEESSFSMRLAVTGSDPQLELIQPLTSNTSLSRTLGNQTERIHHLGFFVTNFWDEVRRVEAMGCRVLEAGGGHGIDGDGAFAYLDTTSVTGLYSEIIEPPTRRPEPEFTLGTPSRETDHG